jgi:carboxyl-terminal processing protease
MRHRRILSAAVVVVVAACDAGVSDPESGMSVSAAIYLGHALDTMETHSIKRFEIDWETFRAQAMADATGAANSFETHPAIEAALERLGDNHSFFVRPGSLGAAAPGMWSSTQLWPAAVDPSAMLLTEGIGYVDVPEFQGGGQDGDDLVAEYHRLIEGIDTLGVACHWVVDLRGNMGGNMWPMVAGIGPILGEGTAGSFLYPDSVRTPWFYVEGAAGIEDFSSLASTDEPYTLVSPRPFVAVLTDSLTASSGEAVAVAFRGRDGARSFGEPTYGVSTVNAGYPLSDGAVMFLTVAALVDRLGTIYGNELEPDELLTGGTKTGNPETDVVLAAAVEWLSAQACG